LSFVFRASPLENPYGGCWILSRGWFAAGIAG
jgi:hypothetical protein